MSSSSLLLCAETVLATEGHSGYVCFSCFAVEDEFIKLLKIQKCFTELNRLL